MTEGSLQVKSAWKGIIQRFLLTRKHTAKSPLSALSIFTFDKYMSRFKNRQERLPLKITSSRGRDLVKDQGQISSINMTES